MSKVNIAKSAGFCFGGRRAITIALRTAKNNKNVCMLGDIVHNEDVVKTIKESGIRKIHTLGNGKGKILILRAHGACKKILNQAQAKGYTIIDATCPMVKEIHNIAKNMEKSNYKIIVIGDKKHDEVHGIIGQLKEKAIIIDPNEKNDYKKMKNIKKACVVCQSTQYKNNVLDILPHIKRQVKTMRFFDTICLPTKLKQKEIETMPLENDVMIIIGSKKSANTKRLYDISHSLNKRTFWVNNKNQLEREWFNKALQIGISAGASTPDKTIRDITSTIQKLTK